MTAPLSPAAQAVLDAAHKATQDPRWQTNFYSSYAAAALRAAADQVERKWRGFAHEACQELRAIAAELDGTQSFSENV